MITLFENIYTDKRPVSPGEIQFMLKMFQQDLKSVLLDISYSADEKALIMLNGGKLICIYRIKNDEIVRDLSLNLVEILQERGRGTLRVCDLTPSFWVGVRTIIEQAHPSKITSLLTSDLSASIRKLQSISEPVFLHIRWPNAEGFVVIPGNNLSARQYAFLAQDKLSDAAAAVSMFSHWSETECIISQYNSDTQLAIWKEHNLQLGFSLLLESILRRYADLAGHSLATKLDNSINTLCHSHLWDIVVGNTAVDDVHVFNAIADAEIAYRTIFDFASQQISQVIGLRLFNQTVDDGLLSLSEPLRQTILKPLLLPTIRVHS